ncbi:MAG TPA: glycoside hydrolase family 88 protein [Cyclobacteriaceae bacterium]
MNCCLLRRGLISILLVINLNQCKRDAFDVDANLQYCNQQAQKTLKECPADALPRNVDNGQTKWRYVPVHDWTSGFWPGILWKLHEATGDEKWKTAADKYTQLLKPLSQQPARDHDLGFQIYTSFGNAYRLTHDTAYKAVVLRTADTLATLFNPKVGTILSWPGMVKEKGWPHNTIIDNLINLELLFWASKNGGRKELYDIAQQHALTTMKNHFRENYTSYHVVIYDTLTGKKIKGVTHQGFNDESMWARGQAWSIYGFTMIYRETHNNQFLDFAQHVADAYLQRLPEDMIPYWDFDAAGLKDQPRDASAAAITASALLELSQYVDKSKALNYRSLAEKMLQTLSSSKYQSREQNSSFLLHSTGHKPKGTEVDASIIYADYYYLEALIRLQKMRKNESSEN